MGLWLLPCEVIYWRTCRRAGSRCLNLGEARQARGVSGESPTQMPIQLLKVVRVVSPVDRPPHRRHGGVAAKDAEDVWLDAPCESSPLEARDLLNGRASPVAPLRDGLRKGLEARRGRDGRGKPRQLPQLQPLGSIRPTSGSWHERMPSGDWASPAVSKEPDACSPPIRRPEA